MASQDADSRDDIGQLAALAAILEKDQADIRAGNFCDADDFFRELDTEDSLG